MKIPTTTNPTKEQIIKACNRAINKIDKCNDFAYYSIYLNVSDNIAWIYEASSPSDEIRGNNLYCMAGSISPFFLELRGLAHLKRVLKSAVIDRVAELHEDGIID